jgi:hypothetical protein
MTTFCGRGMEDIIEPKVIVAILNAVADYFSIDQEFNDQVSVK